MHHPTPSNRLNPNAHEVRSGVHHRRKAKTRSTTNRTTQSDRSHGEVDSDQRSGRVRLRTLTLETTMPSVADRPEAPTAIQTHLAAIFISLELSRSIWLITS